MTQLSLLNDQPAEPVLEKNPYKTEIPKQEIPQKAEVKRPEIQRPEPQDIEQEIDHEIETEIDEEIEAQEEAEDEEETQEVVAPKIETPKVEKKKPLGALKKEPFRKGRPRSEKSRAAILRSTNQLLLHTSVQELSIEAIAKKARVGKTTIYRWWPNKTAVVMEALASQPNMQETLPDAKNNVEALVMQLEKLIRLLHSKNGATIAQLFSEAQGNEQSQEIFENSFLAPLLDAIEFSIEQGKRDGEFRASLDTKIAIDLLCGPIFFRLMSHPADFNEDFEQRFPKQIVKVITA